MDIKEIKQARRELEQTINQLMTDFTNKTGLVVNSVDVVQMCMTTTDTFIPEHIYTTSVHIEIPRY